LSQLQGQAMEMRNPSDNGPWNTWNTKLKSGLWLITRPFRLTWVFNVKVPLEIFIWSYCAQISGIPSQVNFDEITKALLSF